MKIFKLQPGQISHLISDRRGGLATDRIVVDGMPVGMMYRELPINPADSGWRFLAGDEDDDYMSDASRHGIYALNTIANYDRRVIEFLDMPVGSELVDDGSGDLVSQ
ncbi:hypothetical protein ABIE56_003707 [Luteibacter sp. 621]|uniref:DUF2185 domain-containing protein n=1 Tax=Luteibacter sp. 621 TaxID=3373916 RepID=UPI003D1FA4CB